MRNEGRTDEATGRTRTCLRRLGPPAGTGDDASRGEAETRWFRPAPIRLSAARLRSRRPAWDPRFRSPDLFSPPGEDVNRKHGL